MAAKKKRKGAKRGRKTTRSSIALRAGSIVTRKLSPATLKKHGMKLKAVGTLGGKKAYKVVTSKKRRAAHTSSEIGVTQAKAQANAERMMAQASSDMKKVASLTSAGAFKDADSYMDAVERSLAKQDQEHLMPMVRRSELEKMRADGTTPYQASRVFILRWNTDQ